MLFDPKWNVKKPDIWSLDTFTNWISIQNPDKDYSYFSGGNCLIAQYLKAHGFQSVHVGSMSVHYRKPSKLPRILAWMFSSQIIDELPDGFNTIAYPFGGYKTSTFRDALKRAKDVKARSSYTSALQAL